MRAILILLVLVLSGCYKLQLIPYMDQALTLQDLGQEKDRQEKYVKTIDANFDALRIAIDNGDIKQFTTKEQVVSKFGAPIFEKSIEGQQTQALYRYAIQSKSAHRVFLTYDLNNHLTKWESI